ncbi:MAG TPA: hypothetical protein DCS05_01520 [Nitrospiraceae bacterium]|nr:hypothetical protein [Nitrospiraceae bacterium]
MMQVITCGFIDLKKTRRIRTKINRIKTIKPEKSYWTRIKSDGLAKKQVLPRRVLRKPFHSFDKIKKKAAPEEPPCWKCLDVRENEDQ